MKCIWCELETTTDKELVSNKIKYANKEHIFPESVGGKSYLEIGKVCQDCNKRLGVTVDKYLKTENYMMLKQYQDSSIITGKPVGKVRDNKDKERKIKEIQNISGYGGGFKIERFEDNSHNFSLTNLPGGIDGDHIYNNKFSKALHKCAVNVLLDKYDYEFMKSNFGELINFVNDQNNQEYHRWSYGICYSKIFSMVHFSPYCLLHIIEHIPKAVVLIFPCGIFIVSTEPNFMNKKLLKFTGDNIPAPVRKDWEEKGLNFFDHYTSDFTDFPKTFGERVKFTFVNKEIAGRTNPDDRFYLLTKCKACGQTNPTIIMLGKEIILNGDYQHTTGGHSNSWNKLLIKDLSKRGLVIEKCDKEFLQNIIDQGVIYPIENDVTKMNISNCTVKCINCYEWIEYEAKDCFI